MAMVFLLGGGLLLPKIGVFLGFLCLIARCFYVVMYEKSGPDARFCGALSSGPPIYFYGFGSFFYAVYLYFA